MQTRMLGSDCVRILLMALLVAPQLALGADARLSNFDSRYQVAGSFYVILRSDADLSAVTPTATEATASRLGATGEPVRELGVLLTGRCMARRWQV